MHNYRIVDAAAAVGKVIRITLPYARCRAHNVSIFQMLSQCTQSRKDPGRRFISLQRYVVFKHSIRQEKHDTARTARCELEIVEFGCFKILGD